MLRKQLVWSHLNSSAPGSNYRIFWTTERTGIYTPHGSKPKNEVAAHSPENTVLWFRKVRLRRLGTDLGDVGEVQRAHLLCTFGQILLREAHKCQHALTDWRLPALLRWRRLGAVCCAEKPRKTVSKGEPGWVKRRFPLLPLSPRTTTWLLPVRTSCWKRWPYPPA